MNFIGAITLNDFNLCTKQSIGTSASIFKEWSNEDATEHFTLKSDLMTVFKSNSNLVNTFVVDDGPESVRIHKDGEEDAVETYFMDVYGVYKKTFGAKFVTLHNFNTWGIHAEDTEILGFQEIGLA